MCGASLIHEAVADGLAGRSGTRMTRALLENWWERRLGRSVWIDLSKVGKSGRDTYVSCKCSPKGNFSRGVQYQVDSMTCSIYSLFPIAIPITAECSHQQSGYWDRDGGDTWVWQQDFHSLKLDMVPDLPTTLRPSSSPTECSWYACQDHLIM